MRLRVAWLRRRIRYCARRGGRFRADSLQITIDRVEHPAQILGLLRHLGYCLPQVAFIGETECAGDTVRDSVHAYRVRRMYMMGHECLSVGGGDARTLTIGVGMGACSNAEGGTCSPERQPPVPIISLP